MLFEVKHRTHYLYEEPVGAAGQYIRLTPSSGPVQTVHEWSVSAPGPIHRWFDAHGNISHFRSIDRPRHDLSVVAGGIIETLTSDGFIPDLGAAPELLALAFALDAGQSSPRIFEVGNHLVLIQSIKKTSPDQLEIDAQVAGARSSVVTQKRNQIVRAWVDAHQQRLEADGLLRVNASIVIGS